MTRDLPPSQEPRLGARSAAERLRQAPGLELTLPAVPEAVAEMRHAAASFAAEQGAPAETRDAVALAVSEAAANVVMHAHDERAIGLMKLTAGVSGDALAFTVSDAGRGMQPRPDSPGLGLGLAMIATVADSMALGRGPADMGTSVTMTFRMAPAEAPARPQGAPQIARAEEPGRPAMVLGDLEAEAAGPSVE